MIVDNSIYEKIFEYQRSLIQNKGGREVGIFSKLFAGGPGREDWSMISFNISKGLEDVRKTWFNSCVKVLQENSSKKGKDSLAIKIVHIRLGGEANLAIKAFQLYLVSSFLSQHSYISSSKGKDFADILYAQVCGTQIVECMAFFSRYQEVLSNRGTQLFRFTSDVAKYITGNKTPLNESMLIVPTISLFVSLNYSVIANCFGDNKMVKKLESDIEKY